MAISQKNKKELALQKLKETILSRRDFWVFPDQALIKGFMGTDPIFIVGDQPSTDPWPPEHPHRKVFYETLEKVGLVNAHLTDLYKKRGPSNSLANELPRDFQKHLNFFRKEIEIMQPKLIVALGQLAQRLMVQNLRDWRPAIPRIWHSSYVVKASKESGYAANMREMILGNK